MKLILAATAILFATNAYASQIVDFSASGSIKHNLFQALESQILQQVYPNGFVKDYERCDTNPQAELLVGELNAVHGSFTASGTKETLLVFDSVPCSSGDFATHSNLILVEGVTVLDARTDINSAQFDKVWDKDGDGGSEVIVSFSGGNNGYFTTYADTVTFKGGLIKKVNYINGPVASTTCGAKEQDGQIISAVFSTDVADKVVQKNYVKGCLPNSEYKFHSDGPISDL